MIQDFEAQNRTDNRGNPAGGYVQSVGLEIDWQDGPLGKAGSKHRKEPNGAFVETVIAGALQRIEFYQSACGGRYACKENADAIEYLRQALATLESRTLRRQASGVEGTHAPETPDAS